MKNKEKIIAIVISLILIINIVLFAFGLISELIFWIVIAFGFGVSYILKKNIQKNKNI